MPRETVGDRPPATPAKPRPGPLGSRRGAAEWVLPVAAVALGLLLRELLLRAVGYDLPPFITLFPAPMLAAVIAGTRAGLVATGLAVAGALVFVLAWPLTPAQAAALALFGIMGILISMVSGLYRTARDTVAELEFHALADNMAQLAWMADARGRIFWFSRRWYEYTGAEPSAVTGDGWLSVVNPDEARSVEAAARSGMASGAPFEATFRMRGRDGSYRWFLTRVVPVRDAAGRVVRWFGTNTDVTQQRENEEALREADRRKNDFLAMLSHELRNPLAPVRNCVYVLQRAPPGSSQAARALAVLDRQVSHMARLVDDLLDITRIGRGKIRLEREPMDLAAVVRRAAEDHRDELTAAGIAFTVTTADGPLPFDGDPTRIAQVVGNLLHNAAKFTPAGGRVGVTVARAGEEAEIRVSDTGSGIGTEALERLFEPFVQVERTLDRSRGGLGLGLALVKGIVELHGGSVAAQSEGPGRGATFVVRLPLLATAQAPAAPQPMRNSRRVLVIDDELDSARSLKEALELSGHSVELALSGTEGLAVARRTRPEIVLCDIGLPGMNGFEVARALRADPALHGVVLVALSGYAAEEDLDRCRAAGFDRHVAKPADPAAIENAVASLRP